MTEPSRILFIRRDNIGDLVCTTPLFAAIRAQYPNAFIGLLTNTYCAPVVAHNPDLDRVYVYAKAKHVPVVQRPAAYWARVSLVRNLRATGFDHVILAAASYYVRGLEFARWLPKACVIGFASDHGDKRGLDIALSHDKEPRHEVEDLYRLLAPLGIRGAPPAMRVVADPVDVAHTRALLPSSFLDRRPVAVHISARHPTNRWHTHGYVALIRALIAESRNVLLLWSPGEASDPAHPGDDKLARHIMEEVKNAALFGLPTRELGALIAAFDLCCGAILSDGGAMHIAAALKKPLVCLFGNSDATRWYPWRGPHVLLQTENRNVATTEIPDVLSAAHYILPPPE